MKFTPESWEVFSDGIYPAKIEGAQEKTSKKSTTGNPDMIEIKLLASDQHANTMVYDYITKRNVKELAAALGVQAIDGQPIEMDPDDLIGQFLEVQLITEEYMGKAKNRVKAYVPAKAKPTKNEFGEPDQIPF
jgi:hypothetical protein